MEHNAAVAELIDSAIKKVWLEDISRDYENKFLLKEDTMKNSFYFHLRKRLGEAFLNRNNIRIYTEYFINGERIDLAVVEIDPVKAGESYLGDCVVNVIAVIEMKYKGKNARDSVFYKDVEKVLSYISSWKRDTAYYLAFIREKYFRSADVKNWLKEEQIGHAKGKLTELYAYWEEDSGETVWSIAGH